MQNCSKNYLLCSCICIKSNAQKRTAAGFVGLVVIRDYDTQIDNLWSNWTKTCDCITLHSLSVRKEGEYNENWQYNKTGIKSNRPAELRGFKQ